MGLLENIGAIVLTVGLCKILACIFDAIFSERNDVDFDEIEWMREEGRKRLEACRRLHDETYGD